MNDDYMGCRGGQDHDADSFESAGAVAWVMGIVVLLVWVLC